MTDRAPRARLDRWLWAARFFKTRGLAAEAVEGGKVHVNGQRAKPSRELRVGDHLELTVGAEQWDVAVHALSVRRGPAAEARQLYEETEVSRLRREAARAERRARGDHMAASRGRPTKKDRRMIHRFTEGS